MRFLQVGLLYPLRDPSIGVVFRARTSPHTQHMAMREASTGGSPRLRSCRKVDYVIFHAASGKAGISVCETVSIDCVVLEIDLADISGFEVLVQLFQVGLRRVWLLS
ncbi:MAG: hypothetical protein K0S79_1821 [Nitrospira sp.]|jgi:CheY-like chemotaxis protein|nr:hypothetical protein [Nitrospira sp.]